ncbi:deoxyribose-phosphate aldolase [Cryobacterium sp. CAN_C3]|nr:hypothetical protein [Cryobacterium sp. CAN_C3]MEC5152676.1 deoxyribose-phosphate aldolase [Cryobacterium sp. CAN_C3]
MLWPPDWRYHQALLATLAMIEAGATRLGVSGSAALLSGANTAEAAGSY